jgi:hypothetical protein
MAFTHTLVEVVEREDVSLFIQHVGGMMRLMSSITPQCSFHQLEITSQQQETLLQ